MIAIIMGHSNNVNNNGKNNSSRNRCNIADDVITATKKKKKRINKSNNWRISNTHLLLPNHCLEVKAPVGWVQNTNKMNKLLCLI